MKIPLYVVIFITYSMLYIGMAWVNFCVITYCTKLIQNTPQTFMGLSLAHEMRYLPISLCVYFHTHTHDFLHLFFFLSNCLLFC